MLNITADQRYKAWLDGEPLKGRPSNVWRARVVPWMRTPLWRGERAELALSFLTVGTGCGEAFIVLCRKLVHAERTRADMIAAGFSSSVWLFKAALRHADHFGNLDGIDMLFTPDRRIFRRRAGRAGGPRHLDRSAARHLADAARRRVLAEPALRATRSQAGSRKR
jgi:hypothetical protein